jgi:hypothetical protein
MTKTYDYAVRLFHAKRWLGTAFAHTEEKARALLSQIRLQGDVAELCRWTGADADYIPFAEITDDGEEPITYGRP